MNYQNIRWEILENPGKPGDRSIGMITFIRDHVMNAIDVKTRVELDILLTEISHLSQIKVIIITGEGRGFSAGGDLKSEAGPLGVGDENFEMGNFGDYKELIHYFFNDLRHSVLQKCFQKLEDLPQITIAESGLPGFEYSLWFGIWGPAGMPPSIVEKISNDVKRASGDARSKLQAIGNEPLEMTEPQFTSFVNTEIKNSAILLKAAGIEPQ